MTKSLARKSQRSWSLNRLTTAAAVCSLAGLLFGEAGRLHWFLDLFSHFHVQYLFILFGVILSSAIRKRWRLLTAVCLACCWILFRIAPLWLDSHKVTEADPNLRLMTINVFAGNDSYGRVLNAIRQTKPDIVVLQEVTPAWKLELERLSDGLPHCQFAPRQDAFGIAVLSRLPLASAEVSLVGEVPWIECVVELRGAERVLLLATHTLPPAGRLYSATRNRQFLAIDDSVERARARGLSVIIAGDLNCTPWSGHMRDLLDRNQLSSGRNGFGWNPSWPVDRPFLFIPIDHVLVSENIGVSRFATIDPVGSDHSPVVADLVIDTVRSE